MYAAGPGKNDKYYQILGVSKNSLPSALRRAYTTTTMKLRGDREKLIELVRAYEVLIDPVKRRIYDQYGEDAFKTGGCSSSRHAIPLAVSLEDLYNGTTLTICSKCKGKGSKSGASMKCSDCLGSGIKARILHLGCEGTGEAIRETINEEDPFGTKILKLHVEKGMQNGQTFKFPTELLGEGEPDTFFVLQQEEHPKFKRICDDLFVEHTLSLKEALCGFQFVLAHLDNRQLIIKSEPGEVVKPGQVKVINDEGMPMYQRPFMRGKLHIHFTVEFPDSLTPSPRGARRFQLVQCAQQ